MVCRVFLRTYKDDWDMEYEIGKVTYDFVSQYAVGPLWYRETIQLSP